MKRKFLNKSRVASIGVGLALVAGIFSTPFLNAHAASTAIGILIWDCDDHVCYHEYGDLATDGTTNYFNESTATDDAGSGNTFSVVNNTSENIDFALKDDFDSWQADYKDWKGYATGVAIDWTEVKAEYILDGYASYFEETECSSATDKESCVDDYTSNNGISDLIKFGISLNPIWGGGGNNSWLTFADRNFKVMMYNDDFRGVTLGDISSLTYVPQSWDPTKFADSIDISDTTASNPAVLETVLLENTVKITSSGYNSFEIASIEPVDSTISSSAISTSVSSGEATIIFGSNFYDHEIFKITDTSGNAYYLRIARLAVTGEARKNPDGEVEEINAAMFYKTAKTCSDYEVFALIEYENGSKKRVTMEPVSSFMNDLGAIIGICEEDYTLSGFATSLDRGHYTYDLSSITNTGIKGVYFYAQNEGSTNTSYAGSYSGSGRGLYYELGDYGSYTIDWDK